MTPEQEERLGQMMQQEARKSGHVKRIPPDSLAMRVETIDAQDDATIPLIEQYIRNAGTPVTRIEIIQGLDSGIARIDRCLRKMNNAGTLRRTTTRGSALWENAQK